MISEVQGECGRPGPQFVDQGADAADDLDVRLLAVAADVVGLARLAAVKHAPQGPAVVLDEQPVADVHAVAVDRQLLALGRVEDHQRDQLLGELVRPVVVRAVGHQHRQAVGVVVGPGQMVGRGLGGRIGRTGIVGRLLREKAGRPQRAVDLVGRDVQKAELALFRLGQLRPVAQGGVEHVKRAQHVGHHELRRIVDRAIDVRLGGEMYDRRGPMLGKGLIDGGPVGDVGLDEGVGIALDHRLQRIEVAGIGQGVEIGDPGLPLGDRGPHETTADEAGAAGDENVLHGDQRGMRR